MAELTTYSECTECRALDLLLGVVRLLTILCARVWVSRADCIVRMCTHGIIRN
jgi:hypothetical protein